MGLKMVIEYLRVVFQEDAVLAWKGAGYKLRRENLPKRRHRKMGISKIES